MNFYEVDINISPLKPYNGIVVAFLSEVGYDSFADTDRGVKAYIQEEEYDENSLKVQLSRIEGCKISYFTQRLPNDNYNKKWESNFEPIYIGDECVIRAPFHQKDEKIPYNIIISPKMSFGTGHHETTYLMTNEILQLHLEGNDICDMGCGTGVLAILCEMKGTKHVLAVDNDENAFKNCKQNILLNKCVNIDVEKGGAEKLVGNSFSIILANINKNILLRDMAYYVDALYKGGKLLMSGFFSTDISEIKKRMEELGLIFVKKSDRNNWVCIMGMK